MVVQSKSGPAQLSRDKGQLQIPTVRFQQDFGAPMPPLTHTGPLQHMKEPQQRSPSVQSSPSQPSPRHRCFFPHCLFLSCERAVER